MKKSLKIILIMVFTIMLMISVANAATKATLANQLYNKLSPYGLTSSDKVKIERYLSDNPVTDSQADTILAKADEGIAIMKSENTKDIRKLSNTAKNQVKTLAQEAADVIGLTLTYSSGKVEIYNKQGKLVETITVENTGKLAYTGNNYNTVIVVSSVAVIALAAIVIKKQLSKIGA